MAERFALDGYVVDELIGFGGTGEVWRAHDVASGERVALKRLRTRGAAATERLRREATLLASVAGPHVIGFRGLVVDGDEAVLLMDYAAGGSLATVLGVRGRLPAPEVVTVIGPVAAALAAAHARDLVHGDITPANILFSADGRPLLADFGVARGLGGTAPPAAGTVDYIDPAVAAGEPPTAASDVFALGAVGFTALSGRSLWGTGTAAEVLERAARGDRQQVAAAAPDAPAALAEVVESMLSLDPDDRPDARSVAHAVLRACAAAPVCLVHALPPVPPPMTDRLVPPTKAGHPANPPAGKRVQADPGPRGPGRLRSSPQDRPAARVWRRRIVVTAIAGAALAAAAGLGVASADHGRGQARVIATAPTAPTGSTTPGNRKASGLSAPPSMSTAPTASASNAAANGAARTSWLTVVARLDELRARAFAEAEPGLLTSVYAPTASAYSADLATVNSLASRGLRARGFTATVRHVAVEASTATTEQLRVVDALSGYTLVDSAGRVEGRGAARPARPFTMTLTDSADGWRVASISPARAGGG